MFSVLILDDNKPYADYLTRSIPWEEYSCQVVATLYNGKHGLEAILEKHPDIIFADIEMPGLDGISMLEMARAVIPDCKIIIITAHNDFVYAYRAIKLNVFDFLLKPIAKRDLIRTVESAVQELKSVRAAGDQQRNLNPVTLEEKILKYIKQSSCSAISLSEVSLHFDISAGHIGKLIKQETGKTFTELVTYYRMERAKVLLLDGRYRVEKIAELVGYSSYLTFYKVFVREVGTAPTTWCSEMMHNQ